MATQVKLKQLQQDSATDGQVITWDTIENKWVPATPTSGGGYSTISPAEFTSDQNDFEPSGWDSANLVRVSSDASMRSINGLVPSTTPKTFRNIGTNTIFFTGEHPDSTNTHRLALSEDVTVSSRVLILKNNAGTAIQELKVHNFKTKVINSGI